MALIQKELERGASRYRERQVRTPVASPRAAREPEPQAATPRRKWRIVLLVILIILAAALFPLTMMSRAGWGPSPYRGPFTTVEPAPFSPWDTVVELGLDHNDLWS